MNKKVSKSRLTSDGQRVLELLETKYGMTRDNATRLMQDGGAALAVALLSIATRGKL